MKQRALLAIAIATLGLDAGRTSYLVAQDRAGAATVDLTQVHMEIEAVNLLTTLDLTVKQLDALAALAKDTIGKPRARQPVKVSAAYRETLLALHAALKKGDDDQIDDLQEKLDDLAIKEEVAFDDDVELTDGSRDKAGEFLRRLRVTQLTALISTVDIDDPLELLEDALEDAQDLKGQEWKDARAEAADNVAVLLAGVNKTQYDVVKQKVINLLDKAHKQKKGFAKQLKAFKSEAHEIADAVGSFDVVKNKLTWTLAELLANPALPAAIVMRKESLK